MMKGFRSLDMVKDIRNRWAEYDLLDSNKAYYEDNEDTFMAEDLAFFEKMLGVLGDEIRMLIVGGGNGSELVAMSELLSGTDGKSVHVEIVDRMIWPLNHFNEIEVGSESGIRAVSIHICDILSFMGAHGITQYDIIYFSRCINHKDRMTNDELRSLKEILDDSNSLAAFAQIELQHNAANTEYEDNFKAIMGLDEPTIPVGFSSGNKTALYIARFKKRTGRLWNQDRDVTHGSWMLTDSARSSPAPSVRSSRRSSSPYCQPS